MRYRLASAKYTAYALAHNAKVATINAKTKVVDNRAEIARIVAVSAVVGATARTTGFRAGYEFAQTHS